MTGTTTSLKTKRLRGQLAATLALVVLSLAQEALAQPWPGSPPQPGPAPGGPVRTLRTPLLDGAPSEPPFVPAPPGQPPPVGDGNVPPREIPGDTAPPPPVPTGTADPGPSAKMPNFPTGVGHDRSVVRIYHTNNRGEREVTTLRGDTLSADEINQIEGILGINMESGEQTIVATATDAQLAQIQDVLYPYPQTVMNGGRKKIVSDSPGNGYPKPGRNSIYGYTSDHPLPTVWTFSRYLVILGVVSACIFMALASYAMVMGHPYGGSRVFGAAAGLVMLLCAYTIWKIVQMNTFNANSTDPGNTPNHSRPTTAQVQDAFMQRPNTPVDPGAGRANPPRSGIPVVPLGGHG